ncbi:pentapeptide repeat-containing protein [Streptomyces galilaeus]|uniref:pentapeptide repeat-containing protein n=1 Tax=Streptomyces galilaeus TaxID=33899 RepID=UPI0038F65A78
MARPGWSSLTAEARAQAEGQFRLAVVQLMVAVGGAIALAYTARSYRLSHRGQVMDRLAKALERLGSDETYVRVGGILALEQVVRDAPDQTIHIHKLLSAFIRKQAPRRRMEKPHHPLGHTRGPTLPMQPEPDVQAALSTVTHPEFRKNVNQQMRVDLTRLHLAGLSLIGADLSWANLQGADLTGADLSVTKLNDALLDGANLTKAKLVGSNLADADMTGVDFTEAVLLGTIFAGAFLMAARLESAIGLKVEQVLAADRFTGAHLPREIATDPRVRALLDEERGPDPREP